MKSNNKLNYTVDNGIVKYWCVCVCVCQKEGEKKRERERERE